MSKAKHELGANAADLYTLDRKVEQGGSDRAKRGKDRPGFVGTFSTPARCRHERVGVAAGKADTSGGLS